MPQLEISDPPPAMWWLALTCSLTTPLSSSRVELWSIWGFGGRCELGVSMGSGVYGAPRRCGVPPARSGERRSFGNLGAGSKRSCAGSCGDSTFSPRCYSTTPIFSGRFGGGRSFRRDFFRGEANPQNLTNDPRSRFRAGTPVLGAIREPRCSGVASGGLPRPSASWRPPLTTRTGLGITQAFPTDLHPTQDDL